jgi:O-methyltransferase
MARAVLRRVVRRRADPTSVMTVTAQLDDEERAMVERCRPHTLVSPERLVATADAVAHVVRRGIPGALLECGVWRGGSVLAMVLTLQRLGVDDRDVYLFDTFTGMTAPGAEDTSAFHPPALRTFERARASGRRAWEGLFNEEVFGLEQVRELLHGTGYPPERLHFVVGDVLETLPGRAPDRLAVVRLDTDWYASTKHEMEHLYPRLSEGGVLIIDDYGHWRGSRKAVDEYLEATGEPLLLARTDYAGRMAVKA